MATAARTATSTSQLPTGPITPETTPRSAASATKLSFYAKEAVLLTPEDHQGFEALATTVAFASNSSPPGTLSKRPIRSMNPFCGTKPIRFN